MHHILVVDDEPTICEFIHEFLEDEGYQSVCAGNGAEALEQIQRTRPDLVLMDIMMPGLDGREVVRQLQEHPTYSAIPVILMSAAVRWDEAIDGPIQFISKPFDLDRLLRMINQTLNSSQAEPGGGSGFSARIPTMPAPDRPTAPRNQLPSVSSSSQWTGSFRFFGAS